MARRKPKPLPPIVIYMDQPCKNNQVYVHPVDGSCLRCGADQGVACRDTIEAEVGSDQVSSAPHGSPATPSEAKMSEAKDDLIARLEPVAWVSKDGLALVAGGPFATPLSPVKTDWLTEPLYSASTIASLTEQVEGLTRERDEARAENEKMRGALEPFAKVGEAFSWAIGPDGIDDDLTVIIEPVARREWAQHLSTVNFTNARASLSNTSEGGERNGD